MRLLKSARRGLVKKITLNHRDEELPTHQRYTIGPTVGSSASLLFALS